MKKLVIPAFLSGLSMLATGIAIGYLFDFLIPSLKAEYANTALYRSMDDPLMYLFFFQPFVVCGTLVWGWPRIREHFTGSTGNMAFQVALIMFFLTVIPGMLMTFSSFKVSVVATVTWTVMGFFQVLVAALVFIRMSR
ncbi:MAG: hypothetical protein JXA72_10980 [Bacteroidales bacterium]|nr:hypothetical protein [Bacteroidales bacterium]